ncbi:TlpA family protein disulfide reductase [Corynebacterium lizhenjunii]|nr:TlpA disulfide reductase family protein [Corynebacterium lizhenjunii]
MKNRSVVLSVVAMVVLAVLVLVAARAALSGESADSPSASPPTLDQGAAPVSVAQRPDCPTGPIAGVDLPCLGGGDTGASASSGVTVVNVWAWWCQPCRKELPPLMEVAERHPEWTVVGVHADANAANGAAFLEELGLELASYQDDANTFAGTLGLPGVVPITLVLRDGEVVGTIVQAMDSAAEIEARIGEFL